MLRYDTNFQKKKKRLILLELMKVKPPFKNRMIFELCTLINQYPNSHNLFQVTSHNSEVSNFILLLLSGAEVGEEWNL